ncbi:CIDEB protein, partial [Polypterus senegalus]|nr:CIDEB protein [Polypterus senegalus]
MNSGLQSSGFFYKAEVRMAGDVAEMTSRSDLCLAPLLSDSSHFPLPLNVTLDFKPAWLTCCSVTVQSSQAATFLQVTKRRTKTQKGKDKRMEAAAGKDFTSRLSASSLIKSVSSVGTELTRRVWAPSPPPQRPFRVCNHDRTLKKGLMAGTLQELLEKVLLSEFACLNLSPPVHLVNCCQSVGRVIESFLWQLKQLKAISVVPVAVPPRVRRSGFEGAELWPRLPYSARV